MLLPDSPAQSLGCLLVTLSAAVAVVLGARMHRPRVPTAWYLLAAGMAAWDVGSGLLALRSWTGAPLSVAPELLQLMVYPLVAFALGLLTRSRTTENRTAAALDTAILTAAAAMISTVFLLDPAWHAATGVDRWLDVAFPLGNVLLFSSLVRLAYAPGVGRLGAIAVACGLGGVLGYQALAQVLPQLPTVSPRSLALPAAWLIAPVIAGAVALHPSMRALSAPSPPRVEHPHGRQVAALGIALASGPAVIGLQYLAQVPLSAGIVACSYVPLLALVTLRMLALIHQINDQAASDHLTGLPNRRALHRDGRARLSDAGHPQALLMLDLDRFKEINDSLGHHTGDELLIQVSRRLRSSLRADDLLVRLGGDEFAVLLEGVGRAEARQVAASIGVALTEPFDLGPLSVHSAASIGIALFPEHGTDLSTLMRKADVAMYRAKATGGYRMHEEGDDPTNRLQLSEEFRVALSDDQLLLHFQPKIDLATGAARGVEALVRWEHPHRGLLMPDDFLGIVESAGLMGAMTTIVLRKALDQAVVWRAAGRDLSVAVNLSANGLVDVDLPLQVATMLAARSLPPWVLQLEITEELLMADRSRARAVLEVLRETGISISVDDFGTGYSSLAYLRDLPIDQLKLDRTFIAPMADDPRAAALVSSTIALAHSLGLEMVAEGVEDQVAYDELVRLGCDQAQGYFMSRPLPAAELALWFEARAATELPAQPVGA